MTPKCQHLSVSLSGLSDGLTTAPVRNAELTGLTRGLLTGTYTCYLLVNTTKGIDGMIKCVFVPLVSVCVLRECEGLMFICFSCSLCMVYV